MEHIDTELMRRKLFQDEILKKGMFPVIEYLRRALLSVTRPQGGGVLTYMRYMDGPAVLLLPPPPFHSIFPLYCRYCQVFPVLLPLFSGFSRFTVSSISNAVLCLQIRPQAVLL